MKLASPTYSTNEAVVISDKKCKLVVFINFNFTKELKFLKEFNILYYLHQYSTDHIFYLIFLLEH